MRRTSPNENFMLKTDDTLRIIFQVGLVGIAKIQYQNDD